MKFRLLIFLRNFGVLALVITAVCVVLSLFAVSQNLENELVDGKNGLVFLADIFLQQPSIRDDRATARDLLNKVVELHPEAAYAFIDFDGTGKNILSSVLKQNGTPIFTETFEFPVTPPVGNRTPGTVHKQVIEGPGGDVIHDISYDMGEDAGILHLGLSQSAINREVMLQVRITILLCLLVLAVGGMGLYGIARITDKEAHLAEKALHVSEEKYRSLANQVPVGIYRTSESGEILYANPALASMLRYDSVEELMKVPVKNTLVHPDQRNYFLSQWKRSKGVLTVEIQLLTKDGKEIWVRDTGKAVANEKGEILYFDGIIEDITEYKYAQEMREKLEAQLRQAQKMEAIGNLAGGIAHDFNNILSVIIGYSEMTLDNIPEGSRNRANMEKVMVACSRAKEMVQHILTFSRKTGTERKPVLLGEIVREALRLLRPALPSTIDIRFNIQENHNPIMANWTEIHQVLMNLCTNAAYAMRESGGILEILLKEIRLDCESLDIKDLQPGTYLLLTVSDTGTGMNPDILKRIFEPYYTTKPKGEGTGMGLAVAHGIIKSHGGEITVYTEPGKGSTFHIYLPVTQLKKVSEEAIEAEVRGGNEHILFVDDEETLVELAMLMLESLGYTVEGKTSSIDALEVFRRNPDRFALVITDQTMPNMTGIQLSCKLRHVRPGIPIILCTGFSESVTEEAIKANQIDAFVMKPLLKKEIATVIRHVLDN